MNWEAGGRAAVGRLDAEADVVSVVTEAGVVTAELLGVTVPNGREAADGIAVQEPSAAKHWTVPSPSELQRSGVPLPSTSSRFLNTGVAITLE